jgi:hypothetical protein
VRSPKADGDEAARWPLSFRLDICTENSGGRKLERFQNPFGLSEFEDLDAMLPAAPEASSVSSTQYIYLSLDNPSLHFAKHDLAFLQIQADLSEPDSGCRSLHTGYQLPFQDAAVEARFGLNSKLNRSLPPRLGPRGNVSQRVLPVGCCPQL